MIKNFEKLIDKAVEDRSKQMNDEAKARRDKLKEYRKQFRALQPRIENMINIAIELYDNNFRLYHRDGSCTEYMEDDFLTDSVHHRIGFCFENKIMYMGVKAGGYLGENDVIVDTMGHLILDESKLTATQYKDIFQLCKWFVDEIDDFETRLEYYLSHLNDKEFGNKQAKYCECFKMKGEKNEQLC